MGREKFPSDCIASKWGLIIGDNNCSDEEINLGRVGEHEGLSEN